MPCSALEADKQGLQAQLAEIEEVRILPLQASIESLNQEVAARDGALAEQQGRIAELEKQVADAQQQLELKRSKKQAYKQAFAGKVNNQFFKVLYLFYFSLCTHIVIPCLKRK